MKRYKTRELRQLAAAEGRLHPVTPLPEDPVLAERVGRPAPNGSTTSWTIFDVLVLRHGFEVSYMWCGGFSRAWPAVTRRPP